MKFWEFPANHKKEIIVYQLALNLRQKAMNAHCGWYELKKWLNMQELVTPNGIMPVMRLQKTHLILMI